MKLVQVQEMCELRLEDRAALYVHKDLKKIVKAARLPHEHDWQTYHRLLTYGLEIHQQLHGAKAA